MKWKKYPTLYEINTDIWLKNLSTHYQKEITLATVPEEEFHKFANYGFDAVWLMGIWRRSTGLNNIYLKDDELILDCRKALHGFTKRDITGSPYAVYDYSVNPAYGGEEALRIFRDRLAEQGMHLILDFVPNHLALDHPWTIEKPELLVKGTESDLTNEPDRYFRAAHDKKAIFAYGRPLYSAAWPDTVQLDFRNPDTGRIMTEILLQISELCDGVRCDMAMLVLNDVFRKTWGPSPEQKQEFWEVAVKAVKQKKTDFLMIGEVYWDMEYTMQQLGFDYTYDKILYDHIQYRNLTNLRLHLKADYTFQEKLLRFIENHDEERAVNIFGHDTVYAAAVLTFCLPGLKLIHQGQLTGAEAKIPVQLGKYIPEPVNEHMYTFYKKLLNIIAHPVFHNGEWKLLQPTAEWTGNPSYIHMFAGQWVDGDEKRLVVLNLSGTSSQCFLPLQIPALYHKEWILKDLLNDYSYIRSGDELLNHGLYLDLPAGGYHIFTLEEHYE